MVIQANDTVTDNKSNASTIVSATDANKIQTLTEQTMIIKKVFGNDVKSADLNNTNLDYKGVNGAEFKIYDVSDLMTQTIADLLGMTVDELKESMSSSDKTNEDADKNDEDSKDDLLPVIDNAVSAKNTKATTSSNSSESSDISNTTSNKDDSSVDINGPTNMSGDSESSVDSGFTKVDEMVTKVHDLMQKDTLKTELLARSQKLAVSQLKEFATVTTNHDNELNSDGIAKVKLPLDNKYHAYYVTNTKTDANQYATNSEPFIVITPVTQDDGLWAESFTVYPKSEEIPKPKPVKMYQTGAKQQSWFDKLIDTIKAYFG